MNNSTGKVKGLFSYAGGKSMVLKRYLPLFQGLSPEYCVDYFGGSGSMSLWFHQLYPEAVEMVLGCIYRLATEGGDVRSQ